MNEKLRKYLEINVDQFGGNLTLMKGTVVLFEEWIAAAEAGYFGDKYTQTDIERTRQRVADIRSVIIGGSSEKAPLN